MIRITHGSIFDRKCDLLVIPCSNSGNVTTGIFRELINRNLPAHLERIPYGSVQFNQVHYENASVVAFAAAVDDSRLITEPEALIRITKDIANYCRNNQIALVNLPLLGSGAGRLSPIESFDIMRKSFEAENTIFSVFCYTDEIFENIRIHAESGEASPEDDHPRVFISYAGNNQNNVQWVKELAIALRDSGIDARLDQFHLKPGYDLPQWMTNEVIMADKVLLVCDQHYMEKADFRRGGVGWETMIIQGDMLAQGDNKTKYIALLREEKVEQALPIYLRSKYALNWGKGPEIDQERLKELVILLYDLEKETPLGKTPDFIRKLKTKK